MSFIKLRKYVIFSSKEKWIQFGGKIIRILIFYKDYDKTSEQPRQANAKKNFYLFKMFWGVVNIKENYFY